MNNFVKKGKGEESALVRLRTHNLFRLRVKGHILGAAVNSQSLRRYFNLTLLII